MVITAQDLQLIGRAAHGNQTALEEVFFLAAPTCYQFAILASGDPARAAGAVRWVFALMQTDPSTMGDPSHFPETLCRLLVQALDLGLSLTEHTVSAGTAYAFDGNLLDDATIAAQGTEVLLQQPAALRVAAAAAMLFDLSSTQAGRALSCTAEQYDDALQQALQAVGQRIGARRLPTADRRPALQHLAKALDRRFPLSMDQADAMWSAVCATATEAFQPPKKLIAAAAIVGAVLIVLLLLFDSSPLRQMLPDSLDEKLPSITTYKAAEDDTP